MLSTKMHENKTWKTWNKEVCWKFRTYILLTCACRNCLLIIVKEVWIKGIHLDTQINRHKVLTTVAHRSCSFDVLSSQLNFVECQQLGAIWSFDNLDLKWQRLHYGWSKNCEIWEHLLISHCFQAWESETKVRFCDLGKTNRSNKNIAGTKRL